MPSVGALFLTSLVMAALARRLGLARAFHELAACAEASARLTARRGVSDWSKGRAMRIMSWRLFSQAIGTMARLAIVGLPFAALIGADRLWSLGVWSALKDVRANLLLLAAGAAWVVVRKARRTSGEEVLQRVALGSPSVAELTFDIERRTFARAASTLTPVMAPIFVVGLARAGTSILTRLLHETGGLACLTYRDLPFPLAPNSWARLSARSNRHVETCERGHGDGLLHDLDSPEAIEEIFWLTHEADRYRARDALMPIPPRPATIAAFREYVDLVRLRYGQRRYLSKNNNNLIRLPALVDAFPDAILLHPVRHPLQHAASLLKQHRRACALAASEPFGARFMTWMGHHEFGPDLRPFALPGRDESHDPDGINYWLASWISVHEWMLNQPPGVRSQQVFVDYDHLCIADAGTIGGFTARLGLEPPFPVGRLTAPPSQTVEGANPDLAETAAHLHQRLKELSFVGYSDSPLRRIAG